MTWDPETYLAFEAERTRPARELLARISFQHPRRVADLGCGPGNSTALLAARWPDAELWGIDSSPEMLATARASKVAARWVQADLTQWSAQTGYDVLFANATLQWIGDHEQLLPRLMQGLAQGGSLAVQMPRNFDEPSHTLIRSVARGKAWARSFESIGATTPVGSAEKYFAILEPYAAAIDLWETTYVQALEGEDAVYRWMSGTGLRPFVQALREPERTEFLDAYRAALARSYPRRASGVTLFPFRRLFMVAKAR
ncbi:MAG: trans-aconitate 2-methyltransferase [Rhizomicrobium sp.]